MIRTVFHIALLRLWNNKQELLLALVVPVLFFSVFALIFSRGISTGTPAVKLAIVDDDRSPLTRYVVQVLQQQPGIQIDLDVLHTSDNWPLDKLAAAVIRETPTDVVIHLPGGLNEHLRVPGSARARLLSDGTNPLAGQIVSATLAEALNAAAGRSRPPHRPAGSTAGVHPAAAYQVTRLPPTESLRQVSVSAASHRSRPVGESELFTVETTEVIAADKDNPKIAMYAAGIAVMFLLFSATNAGGSLLEEHEAGTLDRLLSSRLSVTQLIAGKWLFITCLGCVQLTVMFAWAQFAFGVDLLGHLPGFAVMASCTAAATASFAMCLAVVCRTRAQLNGVSIVLILTMSAVGGSMIPRYIMSEEIKRWGQLTFNAWALDGFKKVFWYDLPLAAMTSEIQVLLGMTFVLGCLAWLSADRWAVN